MIYKWLLTNKKYFHISAIEEKISCPKGVLAKAANEVIKLPEKWEKPLEKFIHGLTDIEKYEYGCEFSINGNIFYPAYLDFDSLMEFGNAFKKLISYRRSYQIRVRRDDLGKSLCWEIVTYSSYEDGLYFDRGYTFKITAGWMIIDFRDHWASRNVYPRTQKTDSIRTEMEFIIEKKLKHLKKEYQGKNSFPHENIYIDDDNWITLTGVDEGGIRNAVENAPCPIEVFRKK